MAETGRDAGGRAGFTLVAANERLYALGGSYLDHSIEVYDLQVNRWIIQQQKLLEGRMFFSAVALT